MSKIQTLIFTFLLLILFQGNALTQSLTEGLLKSDPTDPLPPDTQVLQEAVWKNFHLKLMLSPSKPYLRGPADFIIEAKKEIMKSPFAGSISIAFENISRPYSPLQETQVTPEDYEADGLAKISHSFTDAGEYAVIVTFTDPQGDLFVLRGSVNIPKENFWIEYQKLLWILATICLLVILFWELQRKKRNSNALQNR